MEIYWFAIQAMPGPSTFSLTPHPTEGAIFLDDSGPPEIDPIVDLGVLGFGVPGSALCPGQGACCVPDGTCRLDIQPDCEADGGVFQGEGTSCNPDPCPPPLGACCSPLGACTEVTEIDCSDLGHVWQGPGTSCTPNPCPPPTGACCFVLVDCQELSELECTKGGGTYQGDLTTCTPDPCPQPQCDLDRTSIDFGPVMVGSFADETFTITNNGGHVLEGTITEACPAFAVQGSPSYFLLPGEHADFTVRFSPVAEGPAQCDLDLGTDCGLLPLSGTGLPAPACVVETPDPNAPLSLLFGDVGTGRSRDLAFTITNDGGGILSGTVTESCAQFSIIGNPAYSLQPGETAVITVRFSPIAEEPYNCPIDTGTDCANLIAIGQGVPPPVCVVDPVDLDFGGVGVGQSAERIFSVSNTGIGDLEGTITEGCPDFAIIGDPSYALAQGESKDFRVRFQPVATGSANCGIFVGAGCSDVQAHGLGEPAPECVIDPASLDFGVVTVDEYRDLTFEVRNDGGGVVSGTVSESCAPFSIIGSTGYSLGAGESKTFTLRFAPTGPGNAECTIQSNCGNLPVVGVGDFAPDCLFNPTALIFGDVAVGEVADLPLKLTNSGGQILTGALASPCPEFSVLGDGSFSLAHGESKDFVVRFAPAATGPFVCTLDSGTAICTGPQTTGRGVPGAACSVSTDRLSFGDVFLGETADRTFTITNTGGGTLAGSVETGCGAFTVLDDPSYSLGPGAFKEFTVRFSPIQAGPAACDLGTGGSCASIALDGTAVQPPSCLVDPTALDFEAVEVGSSTTRDFTVTNAGDGQLQGTVSFACSAFSVEPLDGGGLSYDLASGEVATFRVRFVPLVEGDALCEIAVGDSCSPVTATGTGVVEPVCAVSPDSLDFGLVPMGETRESSFVVRNDGGGVLDGTAGSVCPEIEIVGGAYSLAAGEEAQVLVRFTPSTAGPFSCSVDAGSSCDAVAVLGEGDPLPECALSAESLDLGTTTLSDSLIATFTVSNTGGGVLTGVVQSPCPDFVVREPSSYELGNGESLEITVVFHPSVIGDASCSIDAGSACAPVALQASVEADPVCSLSATGLDFGEIPIDGTADRRITITNDGGGLLQGVMISSCDEFVVVGDGTYALAGGAAKEITIRFQPHEEGAFACTLDTGTECAEVALSGVARPADGACCFGDGSCLVGSGTDCSVAGGTYLGDGTTCDGGPCAPVGACCIGSQCTLETQSDCISSGGVWSEGDCTTAVCVAVGACCFDDGTCTVGTRADCESAVGIYQGDDTTCQTVTCIALGACCFDDGGCEVFTEADCLDSGGRSWAAGATCTEAACEPVGACCTTGGDCLVITQTACGDGGYLGDGTTCGPQSCILPGACCSDAGTCTIVVETLCDGIFLGSEVTCTPELCSDKVSEVTVLPQSDTVLIRVTTAGSAVQTLQGWYRVAGTLDYKQVPSFTQEGDLWTGEFDLTDYTVRGIEYYLTYFDAGLGLVVSHGDAEAPHRMGVSGEATAPSLVPYQYRMVAAPLLVDDPGTGYGLLHARFGEAGVSSWRMGWWDQAQEAYVVVDAQHPTAFESGRAYWLAFATPQEPWALSGRSSLPANDAVCFSRELDPGWNMVGNPAAYAVSLASDQLWIEDAGVPIRFDQARSQVDPVVSEIYVYDPDTSPNDLFYPYIVGPDRLAPWGGCWLENRTDHVITLLIPAIEADLVSPRPNDQARGPVGASAEGEQAEPWDGLSWTLALHAQTTAGSRAAVVLAVAPAADASDRFDLAAPPAAPGSTLRMSLLSQDGFDAGRMLLDAERDPAPSWTLEVSCDAAVTLTWDDSSRPDAPDWTLRMHEVSSSRVWDLRATWSVDMAAGTHRFEIVGSRTPLPPVVDSALSLAVEPNPFRESTAFRFALPTEGAVALSVFNASGHRVWTAPEQQVSAGEHTILWMGLDSEGVRVPAGAYFVRLQAAGAERTQRFVLLK
ncbi:MAG: choice-of-anchor D domain-containing protein [Candidatus Eisenbacteria bacterium]|uniref:Choice-of-anchor D domain-containing protein n=1 Tax=Eiseniibacteriota bacterium TaxID=2212470 RepID=A0A956LXX4_UNCEI|nr:choice-of-anchor D domain-containing protein [Candidatus Eisenbacteria bacterium]